MLMVTPVSCITTSAVRIDSGMLIAATIVDADAEQEQEDRDDREDGAEAALAQQPVARFLDEPRRGR